jgi:hypothetical protein
MNCICNKNELAGGWVPMCCLSLHSFSDLFFSVFWHCQPGNAEPERMESDGEQSLISFSGTCTWGHWGWVVRNPINHESALASFPPTISYLTGKQHRQVNHAHESGAAPLCLSCPMHAWFMNLLCSCLICNVISLIRLVLARCRSGIPISFASGTQDLFFFLYFCARACIHYSNHFSSQSRFS